jgi:hypothetical protein
MITRYAHEDGIDLNVDDDRLFEIEYRHYVQIGADSPRDAAKARVAQIRAAQRAQRDNAHRADAARTPTTEIVRVRRTDAEWQEARRELARARKASQTPPRKTSPTPPPPPQPRTDARDAVALAAETKLASAERLRADARASFARFGQPLPNARAEPRSAAESLPNSIARRRAMPFVR